MLICTIIALKFTVNIIFIHTVFVHVQMQACDYNKL